MKLWIQWGLLAVVVAGLAMTGFQCSSAEMTSAKMYIQRKDYQNALKQLQMETKKNPKNEEGFYMMGQVQFELKEYKGMKESFTEALNITPAHQKDISNYNLMIWGKKFNEGVEAYNKAYDQPDFLSNAIESFEMAVFIIPESLATHRILGQTFGRTGNVPKALEHFTISFEKGNDALACRLIGKIYMDSAAVLRASFIEANKEKITNKKNLEKIVIGMKMVHVKDYLGDPEKITKPPKPAGKKIVKENKETWEFAKFGLIIELEDDLVKSFKFAAPLDRMFVIDSSAVFASYKLYNKAVDIYRKGQDKFPADAEISDNLTNAYFGAERNDEARALLESNVKKYPNNPLYHYNLGVFLLKDNKYEEAISEFRMSLQIEPTFNSALYNLAATYVNWGVAVQDSLKPINEKLRQQEKPLNDSFKEKFKNAVPYLEQFIKDKPFDTRMLELLGQVYANLGQAENADKAYKDADFYRSLSVKLDMDESDMVLVMGDKANAIDDGTFSGKPIKVHTFNGKKVKIFIEKGKVVGFQKID